MSAFLSQKRTHINSNIIKEDNKEKLALLGPNVFMGSILLFPDEEQENLGEA